jgi:hypothetical protein
VIPALALIAAFALGVEIGRWWQRHEHRPMWDELVVSKSKIQGLKEELAVERAAHRATARKGDQYRARARDLAARLANRGAA